MMTQTLRVKFLDPPPSPHSPTGINVHGPALLAATPYIILDRIITSQSPISVFTLNPNGRIQRNGTVPRRKYN